MQATQRLESYLESLATNARPGDRVPTVRQLMSEFGVSQAVVLRATERLKAQGKISAQVGRGTFFVGEEHARGLAAETHETKGRADQKSVLILRRSTRLQRGRRVLELLQAHLQENNCRVVEVAYTDSRDALDILRNLPHFDACIIQSTFETITIDMLAAVRRKSAAIVVDGAVLAGTEVDAVGFEWGSAVELALGHLRSHGHSRIGLVLSTHFVLAAELGRIWFECRMDGAPDTHTVIQVPAWPQEDFAAKAAEEIANTRNSSGELPFSALIVWGVESGNVFLDQLREKGIDVPGTLSVVLLGRTDLESEHGGFFSVAGSTTSAQAEALEQTIRRRWDRPDSEYRVRYLPLSLLEGPSVADR